MKEKDQNGGEEQEVVEEEPIAGEEDDGFDDTQATAGNWYLAKFVKLVVFENSLFEQCVNCMIFERYNIRVLTIITISTYT